MTDTTELCPLMRTGKCKGLCRNYLLTKNIPADQAVQLEETDVKKYLEKLFKEIKNVRYLSGQLEKGASGNYHYQIFINFKSNSRLAAIQKVDKHLHGVHVHVNNGADDYCMKPDTRVLGPFEFGTKPVKRNSKTDWNFVFECAKKGDFDKIDPNIMFKYYKNIMAIHKDYMTLPDDCNHTRGIWIYGPAGAGKSKWCRDTFGRNFYCKQCNKWWDNYKQERFVVMDDVGLNHNILLHHLKIWADRYQTILEIKGGATYSNYEWFVVTSNHSIDDIFIRDDDKNVNMEDIKALKRRFIEIKFNELQYWKFNEDFTEFTKEMSINNALLDSASSSNSKISMYKHTDGKLYPYYENL